jgi:hypothetical protein
MDDGAPNFITLYYEQSMPCDEEEFAGWFVHQDAFSRNVQPQQAFAISLLDGLQRMVNFRESETKNLILDRNCCVVGVFIDYASLNRELPTFALPSGVRFETYGDFLFAEPVLALAVLQATLHSIVSASLAAFAV